MPHDAHQHKGSVLDSTIPGLMSFHWYLRHFDIAEMEPYVDWFNVMTYDIHGAAPGKCPKASGILTSAEIHRIIGDKGLTPKFDKEAAVNWITWDSDQWVSYDDARTFALKIKYAEDKCLGGKMIWAIDQGSSDESTNDKYSGLDALENSLKSKGLNLDASFPLSNGLKLKGVVKDASKRAAAKDTCYTSFRGELCVPGYTSVSTMNGQVGGLREATACQEDNVQSLCCPSGTFTGRCEWYGWRGQGPELYRRHFGEYGVGGRVKQQWRGQHHAKYRQSHGRPDGTCANDNYDGSRCRCEVAEFPLDSLGESYQAAQALRLSDGNNKNGRQGRDWQDFINAEWFPCSFLLKSSPPVTWAIESPMNASDPRLTTNAFIPKYGFDSASDRDQCWATYTLPRGQTSVISDHGFRGQSGPDFPDPMFAQSVGYPRQAYRVDPDGLAANARPTSVASAQWLKKRGDEHETPLYGVNAVQPTRLSELDVDARINPNALKGALTREAQPRGNSVVATASATAPAQRTDPALDRLKGKHELHQVLKRRHSHGHRRRYVD
ncbi:hypothetical protein FB567DRAFT_575909 [Paraphoma chrysanthemicola]|uniref:chitinase n=1 Tax=Paraphoma chrysanthemicola TaxID=798071 RepID=A0A8K0RHW3_9PLEO|nr:hypothetical protein FB567DRAFT_575909 [Paraphoma chrysanthemicola]